MQENEKDTSLLDQILYELDTYDGQCVDELEEDREKRLNKYFKGEL